MAVLSDLLADLDQGVADVKSFFDVVEGAAIEDYDVAVSNLNDAVAYVEKVIAEIKSRI